MTVPVFQDLLDCPERANNNIRGSAMLGLMQDWPLLLHRIIDHAATNHPERQVVTRSIEGPIETTNYAAIRARALRVAKRLQCDGIKLGDRVATLAWNSGTTGKTTSLALCPSTSAPFAMRACRILDRCE